MLEIALTELKKIAADFYRITGLNLVLYNEKKKIIYASPDGMCSFCQKVRSHESLRTGCFHCDNDGLEFCEKNKAPYIYSCHMGLSEAIAPIYENGVIIGYLMIGQILCSENYEKAKEIIVGTADEHSISAEKFLRELEKMPYKSREYINSCVNIMSMCASYLYFSKIIQNKTDIMTAQIKEYIDNHYSENITVSTLCEKFHLSKTALYNISLKSFSMGITEYLRSVRIEGAKQLLISTDMSVNDIAKETGYSDSNYFVRYFSKSVGITPGKFRKNKNHPIA